MRARSLGQEDALEEEMANPLQYSCLENSMDYRYPVRLRCPWTSPGKKTGVGCDFFLRGIFPTQGCEPRSPALRADSLPAEPPGTPDLVSPKTMITL